MGRSRPARSRQHARDADTRRTDAGGAFAGRSSLVLAAAELARLESATSAIAVVTGRRPAAELLPMVTHLRSRARVIVIVVDRDRSATDDATDPPLRALPGATVLNVSTLDQFRAGMERDPRMNRWPLPWRSWGSGAGSWSVLADRIDARPAQHHRRLVVRRAGPARRADGRGGVRHRRPIRPAARRDAGARPGPVRRRWRPHGERPRRGRASRVRRASATSSTDWSVRGPTCCRRSALPTSRRG